MVSESSLFKLAMCCSLLAKTEANREVRAVELANKNCLRQSQMGVGDCAGLPEDELRAAMARSVEKLEARRAREAAEEMVEVNYT